MVPFQSPSHVIQVFEAGVRSGHPILSLDVMSKTDLASRLEHIAHAFAERGERLEKAAQGSTRALLLLFVDGPLAALSRCVDCFCPLPRSVSRTR